MAWYIYSTVDKRVLGMWSEEPDISDRDGVDKIENPSAPDGDGLDPRKIMDSGVLRSAVQSEIDAWDLADAKIARISEVSWNTASLMADGFSYSGKKFPASGQAVLNMTVLYLTKDTLSYPVKLLTMENEGYNVPDAAHVASWYAAGSSFVNGVSGGDTSLKIQIQAAASLEALNAITDDR